MIWRDLDGVLPDFDAGYRLRFGEGPPAPEDKGPAEDRKWALVRSCPDFFETLPWTPFGRDLWKAIEPKGAHILTALAKSIPTCKEQKLAWCRRELGIGPERVTTVWGRHNKVKHCRSGDILIDNSISNITEWQNAGGRGLLVTPEGMLIGASAVL